MTESQDKNYPLLGKALAAETNTPKAASRCASPLNDAIRAAAKTEADDTKRLKRLAGEDVNLRNHTSGWTLLHGQARGGDAQAISVLVKAGANVNVADTGGATPLHVAAQFGHAQAVTALAEAGADVNLKTDVGATPIHLAAQDGHAQAITALAKAGADVNGGEVPPLHVAVKSGYAQATAALVDAGADVNRAIENNGAPPIIFAAQEGHTHIISALVNAGADVNRAGKNNDGEDGWTSLHLAAHKGNTQVITALVKAGADVNRATEKGATPLHLAAQEGHAKSIAALVGAGANANLATSLMSKKSRAAMKYFRTGNFNTGDLVTPMHLAAQNGHAHAIAALVGMDVNDQTNAIKRWSAKLRQAIAAFTGAGVDVNCRDANERTPLHWAARAGHSQAITVLANAGAWLDRRDNIQKYAPIHLAAERGHVQAITALANVGASVNLQDANGNTPLHTAASTEQIQAMKALVNAGANTSRREKDGFTPLHLAVLLGHAQVITALADIGANVNLVWETGLSPLHLAAQKGHKQAITALIKAGADVNSEDINGDTPLYWAADGGHKSAMDELVKFGARSRLPPGNYPVFPCPVGPKSKCGYIYVAANESLGYGVLKIGMTTRAPEKRLAELSGTSLPTPFVCLLVLAASDARGAERIIHRALDEYRMSEGREFFCITPTSLESVLSELAGKPIKMTAME